MESSEKMFDGKKSLMFRINDHGQGPDLVRQVFLERGWVEFNEDTQHESDWNIWWRTSRFRTSDYEQIYPWQRLNHYPKSTGITRKDCLVRHLRRMKGVHGAGVYNFSPMSFNLPNDYTRFVAEHGKLKSKMDPRLFSWICKPADMSRGRGIFIFREMSELQYDCNAVVQRYIANPLLIGGYKFDMRIYVAVPSFHPLTVYVFQEGLVRFSTEKFDLSSLNNVFSHLTNTSINKHSPNYTADKERVGPGCKWTITQLRYYLHQNHHDDRLLWTRIVNIIILTLLIQAPQVPKMRNCFELYGFDILVDENLKPWLLEVNFSPALGTDCQADVMVKKPMFHNLMDMMNFKDKDKERGGMEKHKLTGRTTARGRKMSANVSNSEPFDRNTSSSRLSRRESTQRMNSTISAMFKNIQEPVLEQTVSFIEQENPNIDNKNDDKLCFGLPLVNPSDDEKSDSDASSVNGDLDLVDNFGSFTSRSGRYTPLSVPMSAKGNFKPNSEKNSASTVRLGSLSSAGRKAEFGQLRRHDKGSVKSFGNSDSAYSSFSGSSDNSDRTSLSSAAGIRKTSMQTLKNTALQNNLLLDIPKETEAIQIKSLRPNENSNSLRKMANRGRSPVTGTNNNNRLKNRAAERVGPRVERAPSRVIDRTASRNFDRTQSRNFVNRGGSRLGGVASRSEIDFSKNRPQVASSLSMIEKNPRNKALINIGLNNGLTKTTSTPQLHNKSRRRSFSHQHKTRPKGPPPQIGDFFLVFPFSEGTYKLANSTLDAHAVIREAQKLVKEVQFEMERYPGENKKGGHLPYGALPDAERLWAPVKPPPEEM